MDSRMEALARALYRAPIPRKPEPYTGPLPPEPTGAVPFDFRAGVGLTREDEQTARELGARTGRLDARIAAQNVNRSLICSRTGPGCAPDKMTKTYPRLKDGIKNHELKASRWRNETGRMVDPHFGAAYQEAFKEEADRIKAANKPPKLNKPRAGRKPAAAATPAVDPNDWS